MKPTIVALYFFIAVAMAAIEVKASDDLQRRREDLQRRKEEVQRIRDEEDQRLREYEQRLLNDLQRIYDEYLQDYEDEDQIQIGREYEQRIRGEYEQRIREWHQQIVREDEIIREEEMRILREEERIREERTAGPSGHVLGAQEVQQQGTGCIWAAAGLSSLFVLGIVAAALLFWSLEKRRTNGRKEVPFLDSNHLRGASIK